MERHRLLDGNEAVSPVIGVVLVVAMTIVLVAVAGTLLLGEVDDSAAPTARLTFEQNDGGDGWDNDNDYVNVTHEGGHTLDVENLYVQVDEEEVSVGASDWAAHVSAGDRLSLTDAPSDPAGSVYVGTDIGEGDTIRVVWEDPDSDRSFVVGEHEVA